MSSLAAARADNFYFGPDFDPKNGGINKVSLPPHTLYLRLVGAHAAQQGFLVVPARHLGLAALLCEAAGTVLLSQPDSTCTSSQLFAIPACSQQHPHLLASTPESAHTCLQQQGQHPLRERAKKLDQGILVIRFEMPFNVWCQGCGHLIGKGVRFNAEKQAIGNYHSTKIWSFSMTAPCCQQRIVVHTDPKTTEYLVVSGGRRKVRSSRVLHSSCATLSLCTAQLRPWQSKVRLHMMYVGMKLIRPSQAALASVSLTSWPASLVLGSCSSTVCRCHHRVTGLCLLWQYCTVLAQPWASPKPCSVHPKEPIQ